MNKIHPEIISVKELLKIDNLSIPDYQRPYKWTEKNVNQLIDDILYYCSMSKSAYRLGTVVIHSNQAELNIVDGQQRTLTLALIAHCICKDREIELKDSILRGDSISSYEPKIINTIPFSNEITKYNILQNYRVIERRVAGFSLISVS